MKDTQVEQFMNAMGQTVRYQPVTELPRFEALDRIEKMVNKLYDLAAANSIEVAGHAAFRFTMMSGPIDQARVLQTLAELEYLLQGTYLTFGFGRSFQVKAFAEIHHSNMTRCWSDGKVHRDTRGQFMHPETFHPPVMADVLKAHVQPNLFESAPPPVVTHDDDCGPITMD